jgi:uncharacterized protein (TIGR03067 family)
MRRLYVSIEIVALLSVTGCAEPRSPERAARAVSTGRTTSDLEKLRGTWRIESSTWNGVEEPEVARTVTILFEGHKFIVVDRDGNRQQETITLMPDRSPKAIDCTNKGGGQPSPGIYVLEGDTFKWCSAGGANKVRPTEFSSPPGSRRSLMVLRRART